MRVEAESTSSHGAAILAFEASGLRALSSLFERKTVAIQRQLTSNKNFIRIRKQTHKLYYNKSSPGVSTLLPKKSS